MPAILTLDYEYVPREQAWFHKKFSSYSDLFKWLREDSIIILPSTKLADEEVRRNLLLSKLALPKVKIIIISPEQENSSDSFFIFSTERELEDIIEESIINQHKIRDNRQNLKKILEMDL